VSHHIAPATIRRHSGRRSFAIAVGTSECWHKDLPAKVQQQKYVRPGSVRYADAQCDARRMFWKLASSSSSAQNSEQHSLPMDERHVGSQDEIPTNSRTLKRIGGSQSDDWNHVLGNQALQSLWIELSDKEVRQRQYNAAIAGLIGIAPQDEIEGMIAAQLVATHNATMECYRRAMIGEQTLEGRRENLKPSQQALSHLRDFDRGA
jgi:hypothetical protein